MKLKPKNIFKLQYYLVSSSGYEFYVSDFMTPNLSMILIESRKIEDLGKAFRFLDGQIYQIYKTSDKGKFSLEPEGEYVTVPLGRE